MERLIHSSQHGIFTQCPRYSNMRGNSFPSEAAPHSPAPRACDPALHAASRDFSIALLSVKTVGV